MSTTPVTYLVPMSARPLRERVAATVRAEMARYNIQQSQVANALGISGAAVSMKLSGKRGLSLDDLEAIAPLLGMTPSELIDGGSANPRPGGGPDGGSDVTCAHRDSNPEPAGSGSPQVGQLLSFPGHAGERELERAS